MLKIPLGYVVAFICGIGIILLIIFINNQRQNDGQQHSGIFPLVYNTIQDKQKAIRDRDSESALAEGYRRRLLQARRDLDSIKFPKDLIINTDTQLISQAIAIREEIQKSFNETRLTNKGTPGDEGHSRIDDIAEEVEHNFGWTFDPLWSNELNQPLESIVNSPGGPAYLANLRTFLGQSQQLQLRQQQLSNLIGMKIDQIEDLEKEFKTSKEELSAEIVTLNDSMSEMEKSSKDRMLMYVVIPLFGIIVVLLLVLPSIYKSNESILRRLFEDKIILQIFTVFILVMTILLLGIGDKIRAETLGTLLGGISVYILQKTRDDRSPAETPPPPPPPAAPVPPKENPDTAPVTP